MTEGERQREGEAEGRNVERKTVDRHRMIV
jgi:hypothetical protein